LGAPADCPISVRHEGGVTLGQASIRNTGTCRPDAKRATQAASSRRCWQWDWVLDLDIESFFDRIDWKLLSVPCAITRIANGCSCTLSDGSLGGARRRVCGIAVNRPVLGTELCEARPWRCYRRRRARILCVCASPSRSHLPKLWSPLSGLPWQGCRDL
jgi:hypothetical protein